MCHMKVIGNKSLAQHTLAKYKSHRLARNTHRDIVINFKLL